MARVTLAVLALATVLLAAPALAQFPGMPGGSSVTLSVTVAKGPAEVALGANATIPVKVDFSVSNIICPQAQLPSGAVPGVVTIKLKAIDRPSPIAGITPSLAPQQLTFNITTAQYVNSAYTASGTSQFTYTVAKTAMASHDHTFNITATFDGTISGCQALTGSIPSAVASGEHQIKTGPGAAPTSGTGTGSASPTTTKKSPGFGTTALVVALAALVIRRKEA